MSAAIASPRRSAIALVRRGALDRRRALATWGGSLGVLAALLAAVYPSIETSLADVVEGYPQGLKDAFGIDDLATVEQYLAAEAFGLIVPFALAVFAIRSVARALAGAEEQGGLDVLLAAPVPRGRLVTSTLAATGLAAAGILAISCALLVAGAALAGAGLSTGLAVAGAAMVWPFAMLFAGVATLASGLMRGSARVTGASAAVLTAMYVFDVVGRVVDGAGWLRALSAFRWYGSAIEDGVDALAFAGLLAAGLLAAAAGAALFSRRDLVA